MMASPPISVTAAWLNGMICKGPVMRGAGGVIMVALLIAPRVRADGDRARALFTQGEAAYSAGRFGEAARLFEDAYADSHRPELLWNIAQSHKHQYDIDHDVQRLRTALSVLSNYQQLIWEKKAQDEARDTVRETRALLDQAEREEAARIAAERAAAERAAHALTPAQRERRWRIADFSLLAAGGATLIVGLTFGLLAHSEAGSVQSAGAPGRPVPFGTVADHESRGQTYEVVSYALYGIGAAAAATGAVLLAVQARGHRSRMSIAPTFGGVVLCGRF
jgi:hypothetical protein